MKLQDLAAKILPKIKFTGNYAPVAIFKRRAVFVACEVAGDGVVRFKNGNNLMDHIMKEDLLADDWEDWKSPEKATVTEYRDPRLFRQLSLEEDTP